MKNIIIDNDNDGVRLDRILRKHMASTPLSLLYRSLRKGQIRVNGKKIKQQYRVAEGDVVTINITDLPPETIKKTQTNRVQSLFHTEFFKKNFNLVFEDEHLLVCNKPSGLVVHAGTGHQKNECLIDLAQSYILNKSKDKNTREPQLVHRLDKDTSGIILIAKNKQILRALHTNLRNHTIKKQYIAFCHGIPNQKKGTIDLTLEKTHEPNNGMKVKVSKNGVQSLSTFQVLRTRKHLSQLRIDLHTGKTHQIRVHLSHIGCPIIGDIRYGDNDFDAKLFSNSKIEKRLYLHSEQITFFHPDLNREVTFSAPIPQSFIALLK